MIYNIKDKDLSIKINDFGAEIISVQKNGVEKFWQNPTGEWNGHAPVLFPFCGQITVNVKGIFYELILHGFASKCQFSLVEKTEKSITLKLEANDYTKNIYPYDFVLEMGYRVENDKLIITHNVYNPTEEPIYFGFGGHESYVVDGEINDYYILFEKEEKLVKYLGNGNRQLTGETIDMGTSNLLQLAKEHFEDSKTLILSNIKSDKVWLQDKNGKKIAEVNFKGIKNLLFWSPDNKTCICIEPWSNLPDLESEKDLEFDKKGFNKLEGKGKFSFERVIKYF